MKTRKRDGPMGMRILFVGNTVPDYMPDVVYHGLTHLLGADQVVDLPPVPHYHGKPATDGRAPLFWFDHPEPPTDVDAALDEADAIVIGSLGEGALPTVRHIVARAPEIPIAYLDGEDDPYVREILDHVDVYFKRETLRRPLPFLTPFALQKIHFRFRARQFLGPLREVRSIASEDRADLTPLTFAFPGTGDEPIPERGDRYDVAFLGMPSSRVRIDLVRELRTLEKEGYRVFTPKTPLGWQEYMQVLTDSRICVSLRGAGWDTLRYWEIPFAGSMLLSEHLQIVVPQNFVDGVEAAFAAPRDIVGKAREILRNGDPEAIATKGAVALRARHMSVHRAQTVIDALKAADPAKRTRQAKR